MENFINYVQKVIDEMTIEEFSEMLDKYDDDDIDENCLKFRNGLLVIEMKDGRKTVTKNIYGVRK